jgi:hypothetical protein
MTLIIFGEEYKLCGCLLCRCLQSAASSCFIGPNILLRVFKLFSSLDVGDQVSHSRFWSGISIYRAPISTAELFSVWINFTLTAVYPSCWICSVSFANDRVLSPVPDCSHYRRNDFVTLYLDHQPCTFRVKLRNVSTVASCSGSIRFEPQLRDPLSWQMFLHFPFRLKPLKHSDHYTCHLLFHSVTVHLEWAEHVARVKRYKNAYKILFRHLFGNPEGKKLLGRPRHRWEDNIKMDPKESIGKVWIRFIWLRAELGVGLLLTRWRTFAFHKRRETSWLT